MPTVTDFFVMQRGHVMSAGRLFFVTYDYEAQREEVPNGQLFILSGGATWTQKTVDWTAVAITSFPDPNRMCFVLGRDGDMLIGAPTGFEEEEIGDAISNPRRRGPMRDVRAIGRDVYAVGMGRQVYRRDAREQRGWDVWERGLPAERPRGVVIGFNAIDGFDDSEVYAVGWGGEIWRNDGRRWERLESPTDRTMFDVIVAEPGVVYGCGQSGLLLRGRNDRWEIIEHDGPTTDFRKLAWFKDKLYIADGHGVYVLSDTSLRAVDFGVGGDVLVPAHDLHARDGILLTTAGKEAYTTTDAISWTQVPA